MRYHNAKKREFSKHNSIVIQLDQEFKHKNLNDLIEEKSPSFFDLEFVVRKYKLNIEPAIPIETRKHLEKIEANIKNKHYRSLSTFWRLNTKRINPFHIPFLRKLNLEDVLRDLRDCDFIVHAYEEFAPEEPGNNPTGSNPLKHNQSYRTSDPLGIEVDELDFSRMGTPSFNLFDVEQSWNLEHEDIDISATEPIVGVNRYDEDQLDHGTAVLGILNARDNEKGVLGIGHFSDNIQISSHFIGDNEDPSHNLANAIYQILEKEYTDEEFSKPGDIILIEAAYPWISDRAIWPVEINALDRNAIIAAVDNDRVVIVPAGNGGCSLDNLPFEDDEDTQNVPDRLNPNSLNYIDTGAIFVGAGSPDDDLARWFYSNYGDRIDCFSWGEKVATTGFAGLHEGDPTSQHDDYSATFNGTSSASAIIASIALIVQEFYAAHNEDDFLSPREMRACLSWKGHGIPQNGSQGQYIGYMPKLSIIIEKIIAGTDILPPSD